jgi:hypothetical protein
VVIPPKVVATAPPPPAAPPPAATPPPPEEPPVVREIAVTVAAPPAARTESIPPPPPITGALWVSGHWRLMGSTWHWIPGRWIRPPSGGSRYRPPAVHIRGAVRIYIPGGWLGGR